MANQVVCMSVLEHYCAKRNDKYREAWRDLHELMQSVVSKARKTLYVITATM